MKLCFLPLEPIQSSYRHVQQLSGNGREDGQKGEYAKREILGTARLSLTTNTKVEFVSSLKKRGHVFAARRVKEHAAR
jgi:hypothetical protein